jgi:hypothetical protein
MLKNFFVISLVVLVAVASAQNRQGRQGGRQNNNMIGLLQRSDVQSELKLSDDQKSKLEAMRPARGQGGNRGGGNGGGGNGGGGNGGGGQRPAQDPEAMAKAAAEQAVGPGFANFVGLASPGGGSRATPPPAAPRPFQEASFQASTQRYEENFEGTVNMNRDMNIPNEDPRGGIPPAPTARRTMLGPSGVDDILRTLNAAGDASNRLVPQPALDIDETGSVISGQTTETMRRNGTSRKRKATVQPTGTTLTLNV